MLASPRCCWCGYWCCVCVNTAPLPHYLPESEHVRDTKKKRLFIDWKPLMQSEKNKSLSSHLRCLGHHFTDGQTFFFFFFQTSCNPTDCCLSKRWRGQNSELILKLFPEWLFSWDDGLFFLLSHSLTLFWKKKQGWKILAVFCRQLFHVWGQRLRNQL